VNKIATEVTFCRRCGERLEHRQGALYICTQDHRIFANASPATALILVNDHNELLVLKRARDPGKGMLDAPGGFCDGPESLEAAIVREVKEEVGFDEADYTAPRYLFSQPNAYEFGGETLPALDCIFVARMKTNKEPVAGDDAAAATWVPAAELDLGKVCFPSVREGYRRIIESL
jgi:ADP-ribose pyrophosphatase YjhB (NUDIX family)